MRHHTIKFLSKVDSGISSMEESKGGSGSASVHSRKSSSVDPGIQRALELFPRG